ncbi:unnamed protein product [Orchesella dallaii]|uniref:C2H2-type domain-containing protein n=1 Tax=Orchesella dallaii TaxID=48710 RepID=A0ABP1R2N2_9HEXA
MVVLELEGHNMLGSGPNQYLQPDYLSPLASPLDSKVSPLALLAQTCSQIGADGPSSKSIFETSKRKLSTCSESSIKSESSDSKDSVNNNKEYSGSSGGGSGSHNHNSGSGSGSSRPKSSSSCSSLTGANNTSSSSSSSMNKSSHNSGGGGGKSSPALSPNGHTSPVFKPYEITKSSKENSSEKHSHSERSSKQSKNHHHNNQRESSHSRGSANCSPKVKTPNSRSTPDTSKSHSSESLSSSSEPKKSSSSSGGLSSSDRSNLVEQSKSSPDHGASPIIRSGLEVLQQGQFGSQSAAAEYNRKLSALHSLSALGGGYPPGFDPLNPAFRPPFMGPPHPHAAHLGYALPGTSPYVSYSRVKTASGAETIVPVCKDPYCTGCQYGGGGAPHGASPTGNPSTSNMNGLMAAAAAAAAAAGFPGFGGAQSAAAAANLICPAGCVQCDHPKFPLSSFPHLFGFGGGGGGGGNPHQSLSSLGGYPSSLLSQHSAAAAAAAAAAAQQNAQRPYVCNWIVGDNYCGKRFPSSEELLQHLRTHTNSSGSASSSNADSAALAAMVQQQHQIAMSHAAAQVTSSNSLYSSALLNPSAMAAAAAAMHRTYPTPPLSPLSAARYHPYAAAAAAAGKASGLSGLTPQHPSSASPGSAAAAAAALSSYYPYSAAAAAALYGQRLGPSVHQ